MSLIYEWIDENQYYNQYVPYNNTNGKVNVYSFNNMTKNYDYKFCYYIPFVSVPKNALIKSSEETPYSKYIEEKKIVSQDNIKSQQTEYAKEENNVASLLTLPNGEQVVLNQLQTLVYLYNFASQLLEKNVILEKNIIEEQNKNLLLTEEIEKNKQLLSQLYIVNQNISNEYYKLQQNKLMKIEQNNINRRNRLTSPKENIQKKEVKEEVKEEVKTEVNEEVNEEIKTEVKEEVKTEVKTEVKEEIKTEVKEENNNIIPKNIQSNNQFKERIVSWIEYDNDDHDDDNQYNIKEEKDDIKKSYLQIAEKKISVNNKLNKNNDDFLGVATLRTITCKGSSKVDLNEEDGWEKVKETKSKRKRISRRGRKK